MQRLDQDLFLKRRPADHAISFTTQHILPTTANIAVNAGTLYVIKVIRNGEEIETKPVFVIPLSSRRAQGIAQRIEPAAAEQPASAHRRTWACPIGHGGSRLNFAGPTN